MLMVLAPSAQAYEKVAGSGYTGTYSLLGLQQCVGPNLYDDHQRQMNSAGPIIVYEANGYRRYRQTVYMLPTLQQWVNGAWKTVATGAWESGAIPADTQYKNYSSIDLAGGQGWNVSTGYYRIRMEVQWYVAGTRVGWTRIQAQGGDLSLWGDAAAYNDANGSAYCAV
jgi:hypothetical protein